MRRWFGVYYMSSGESKWELGICRKARTSPQIYAGRIMQPSSGQRVDQVMRPICFHRPPSTWKRNVCGAGAIFLAAMFMAGAILKAEKAKPAPAASANPEAATAHKIDFNRDIAPIFQASCVACHGAEKPLGQLRLDSETALLRGGASGNVIVSGKSGESLLVKRLLGQGGAPRMPMGPDALPKAKIDLIRAWIDQGLSTAEASSVSHCCGRFCHAGSRDACRHKRSPTYLSPGFGPFLRRAATSVTASRFNRTACALTRWRPCSRGAPRGK